MQNSELNFGTEVSGKQSPNIRHAYFRQLVRKAINDFPGESLNIVEIGSWVGASAITWGCEVRALAPEGSRVHCVDPWTSYFDENVDLADQYKKANQIAGSGLAFTTFQNNIAAAGLKNIVATHRGMSAEILPKLKSEEFHIVYIDGDHKYDAVTFDIREAKRLVKPGGYIAGDDLELTLSQVEPEVHKAGVASGRDFSLDGRTGQVFHPGVTQAVADAFAEVYVSDGFWAVKKGLDYSPAVLQRRPDLIPDHLPKEINEEPKVVWSNSDFNLVAFAGRFYGVRKSLGPVDLGSPDDADLIRHYGGNANLIIGTQREFVKDQCEKLTPQPQIAVTKPSKFRSILKALPFIRQ